MYADDTPLRQGPHPIRLQNAMQKELEYTYKMALLAENLEKQHKLQLDDLDCIGAFLIFNSAIAADRCIHDYKQIRNEKFKIFDYFKKIPDDLYFEGNDSDDEATVFDVIRVKKTHTHISYCFNIVFTFLFFLLCSNCE